jgi:5-formyltetrahydrofolate cyclo-ligase
MTKVDEQKATLRRAVLAVRNSIAESDRARLAQAAALRGMAVLAPWLTAPSVVAAYWPMRSELDPRPLLAALASRVVTLALPVVVAPAQPLLFRRYLPGDVLVTAGFGQSEPQASAPTIEPDILIVPLAAIDDAGYRLGYGGGFYDRTLADLQARKVITTLAFAFDEQRVAVVPRGPYDIRLDWLVTPTCTMNFGASNCGHAACD